MEKGRNEKRQKWKKAEMRKGKTGQRQKMEKVRSKRRVMKSEFCQKNGGMKMEELREERHGLKGMRQFLVEEEGMGTVEVILIIVVLVGLVIIFKDQITKIVNNLFDRITSQTGKI